MQSSVLVLGNGESRTNLSIPDKINRIIGCNACYRDVVLSDLVCCDTRMVKEAIGNSFNGPIYTRAEWVRRYKNTNVKPLPELPYTGSQRRDQPINWGSGPYAVLLACKQNYKNIFMAGFDLYSSTGLINNVYKDTENYHVSDAKAVDPSYWIYQISKIFETFSNKNFYIINDSEWNIPAEWLHPNICFQHSLDL